ncbi:hypothetical protein P152DRAFT_461276 [Eremomyces bilateralis CBS 781.70]|uniref:Uncharacterized protein n=1 Tax=Eremomyces bilateralis CBS 781.70 TaxID=1392243 RepID=A0A6G1FV08_9PEZI|nr:uncharacterized protein P152DRAFT_461276 [Eremomyces bilateralis CBS 781.70]KAF1809593.1 hypothetical protein P152DRAFT_461276 [Eremomyces bilateralis CBS 781.70]
MTTNAKASSWLIQRLDDERTIFDNDVYPLSIIQNKRFNDCVKLLREGETSLASRSGQRSSRRRRVRLFLADVFSSLGSAAFLLCTLAAPITTLATVRQLGLLQHIGKWWKTVPHPRGLVEKANKLCSTASIPRLVSQIVPNRNPKDTTESHVDYNQEAPHIPDEGQFRPTTEHTHATTELQQLPREELLCFKSADLSTFLRECQKTYPSHRTVCPSEPSSPAEIILEPTLGLSAKLELSPTAFDLKKLLSLVQKHQECSPNFWLECPWDGVPLPSINLVLDPTLGLTAKLELSLRLSEALMKHLFASKGPTNSEVSH